MTPRRWTISKYRGSRYGGKLPTVSGPDTDPVEVLAVEDAVEILARAIYEARTAEIDVPEGYEWENLLSSVKEPIRGHARALLTPEHQTSPGRGEAA